MDKEILRQAWKQIKKPSAGLHAQYCLMKALTANSNEQAKLALSMLYHAFTPISNPTKLKNGQQPYQAVRDALTWVAVYGSKSPLYTSDQEAYTFDPEFEQRYLQTLMQVIQTAGRLENMRSKDRTCLYLYVRNDLPPEQITVHTAHLTYEAGYRLGAVNSTEHPSIVVFGITSAERMAEKFAALPPTRILGSLDDTEGEIMGFILKPILASVGRRKKYFVDDQLMTMINPERRIIMIKEEAVVIEVLQESSDEAIIRDEC